MTTKTETPISKLFQERKRALAAQGYRGREIYRLLAGDEQLPADVGEMDAAAIIGVQPETMKARRRRRQPPPFTRRLGDKNVVYAVSDLCDLMAAGTVEFPIIAAE